MIEDGRLIKRGQVLLCNEPGAEHGGVNSTSEGEHLSYIT
jgi:hypothetical protein